MLLLTTLSEKGFEGYVETMGYAGILIWFMTIDQATPVPEEITLLIIGYLSSVGIFNPFLAGLVSLFAMLSVDVIYYLVTRSGKKIFGKKRKKREGLRKRYEEKLRNNMGKTVLTLCFIPRMRFWNPILVALLNLPFRKFLLFDFSGLTAFVIVYLGIGYVFHSALHSIMKEFESLQHYIFGGFILLLAIVFVIVFTKLNREKKNTQAQ